MAQIKFIRLKKTETRPSNLVATWILVEDDWDDYSRRVQFRLSYVDKSGLLIDIGKVKILQRLESPSENQVKIAARTNLPAKFSSLDENFISLGQDENYFRRLSTIADVSVDAMLTALRDISWTPVLANDFEPSSEFRNALIRFNSAQRARRFGRLWALGEAINESFSFSYNCQFDEADGPIATYISFDEKDVLPPRIVAIIGRNAVGKTRFLAQLSEDLVQLRQSSGKALEERDSRFPDGRPIFTRVIAISYSAFDRFKRPPATSASSYVYCGIRNDRGGLSRKSLIEVYRKNQARIRQHGRESDWLLRMQAILGDHSQVLASALENEIEAEDSNTSDGPLSLLSSGQSILCHFITALLAWIEPNSLVLFDEPETHLHPNAVASLISEMGKVLENYDSFAILATHSPVVIQEIPAKRVLLFQRVGNTTTAEPLTMESFGESLSALTRHVFETVEIENPYKKTLRSLARDFNESEVLELFDNNLSLNAQAYLLAQYPEPKK
jgi:predicted ATPase